MLRECGTKCTNQRLVLRNKLHGARDGDALHDLRGAEESVVAIWHGGVAPSSAYGDVESSEALLSNLQRIDAPAGGGDCHTPRLSESNGGIEPVLSIAEDECNPVFAARLLVRRGGEDDVASESGDRIFCWIQTCGACAGAEESNHANLHGERPLHINCAATPDVAVLYDAFKWVHRPAVLVCGDNVQVREEEECAVLLVARVKRWVGGGGAAAQAHADVAAIGDRLEELWLQTLALQEFNQHLGGACLISWRVDALGANQLHQILRRFGADLL